MALCEIEEGVSLYYEEYGEGDRYLLCTQQGHSRFTLEREMARRGFHVFLLTNRGFGRSTHVFGDPGKNWYDMWADDVVSFADAMGISKFCYSGASHGSGTGWHLVLRHPERVICFFAVVPGPHSLEEGKMSYKNMLELGLVEPKPMTMPTDDPRLLARRKISDRDYALERMSDDWETVLNAPEVRAVEYGRPLTYYGTEEKLKEALRSIETPVLIMGGTEDFISRPDLMVRSAECLKNCKTVIYSGFGHNIDICEELADEAVRFYENWTSTGRVYAPVRENEDRMSETVQIGKRIIRNRIAIPPMVCFHWSDDSGMVTEKNIRHYEELAKGGAGLIIVEATAITKRARLHETELGIWDDSQIEGLKQITNVIHANGAKTFLQIVHAGGNGIDEVPDAPSEMDYWRNHHASEMSKETIQKTEEDFVAAALRAKAAGFDGVELHGCHGYLVSCFFSPLRNVREDEYGQDKALFAREILTKIREACGEDFVVGIRIAAFEPTLEDGLRNAKALADCVDFMDVSYGVDSDTSCVPDDFPCSGGVYGAMRVKQELPDMCVFGVHKINSREDVINALATGIDMADVGKASLVDPAFAGHVLEKKPEGHCLECKNFCRWNPFEMAKEDLICPGAAKYKK